MNPSKFEYAGFWLRVLAAVVDSVLVLCVTFPFLIAIYGWNYLGLADAGFVAGWADLIIKWVAPAIAIVLFWVYRQATPGKMLFALRVLDAGTGNPLTPKQAVIRYLCYYVSTIPLGLGLLWVVIDPKKQGWHDKLAKTVVIQNMKRVPRQGNASEKQAAAREERVDDTFLSS